MQKTFDVLLLIARPAAGKSEIIDFLKKTPIDDRKERFHIGDFEEIDDFPMLWTWFEEDRILEELGHPRLHSDDREYFIGEHMWDLLIRRICLDYSKKLRDEPDYHTNKTTIIEFARGSQHGGFKRAFDHLSEDVLSKMAILYIDVSWDESLRKNLKRMNPEKLDSILEHSLENEKMENLYKESDWAEVSSADPEFIEIKGHKVPYVVFENEDDKTTQGGEVLGSFLENKLQNLWEIKIR